MATVGVIFGGRSVEHDVSIVTAHQVMEVLSARHEVVPVYVTRAGAWLTSPALNDIAVYENNRYAEVGEETFLPPVAGYGGLHVPGGRLRGSRRVALDVVIPAIHGTFGEDGTLQGLLELADVPYAGAGVVASAVGMDKVAMKSAFIAASLPVVDGVLVEVERLDTDVDAVVAEVERSLAYPVFVKPSRLGSSVGIGKAVDRGALVGALDVARRYDRRIIVERAMEGCIEINCSVLGGPGHPPEASVCEQPVAWEEFLTFSDKYLRGGKGEGSSSKDQGMASLDRRIPAPISDELTKQVQENALAAFGAIDAAGVARVDSFVNEATGEAWVMEINTVPGSFAFYLWEESGVSFADLLERLIHIAESRHREKGDLMFTFESGMLDGRRGGKSGG
ncbi:MAG TPA: D-alanine--D-alanine ligase family protein [Actinomycetota bacterium]|nr:D-alanine--D-alanine ligase family protein [Actinomycetota bacterium]